MTMVAGVLPARNRQALVSFALLSLLPQPGLAGYASNGAQSARPIEAKAGGQAGTDEQQQQHEQEQRRLIVPLSKKPRAGGAVYGVDVTEGGISRRKLKQDGVVGPEGERERVEQIVRRTDSVHIGL